MSDTTMTQTEAPSHRVGVTDAAAEKVRSLLVQEGREDLRLRRFVPLIVRAPRGPEIRCSSRESLSSGSLRGFRRACYVE